MSECSKNSWWREVLPHLIGFLCMHGWHAGANRYLGWPGRLQWCCRELLWFLNIGHILQLCVWRNSCRQWCAGASAFLLGASSACIPHTPDTCRC